MKSLVISSRSDLRDKLIYAINTADLQLIVDTILYDDVHDSFINNDLIQSMCIECVNKVSIIFYDLMILLNQLQLLNINNMDIIGRYVEGRIDGELSWKTTLDMLGYTFQKHIYNPEIRIKDSLILLKYILKLNIRDLKKAILLE